MQQALAVSPANDRNLFVNPDGSPIGKGEMTRVVKQIKVPGIMTDEQTGKKLDTLQEAYDLRRMWVTLALNEFPGEGNRVGAAQGRAVGATTGGGGALKEYYSPSRGFYGDAATKVPFTIDQWLFEARVDELPERMKPPAGQRISYKTDFTGPSLSPIFEPEDAPIRIGDIEAKYFEPTQKVEVVQPTTAPVSTSEPTIASRSAEPSAELLETLEKNGIDWKKTVANFGKKTTRVLGAAIGVETARQIVTEPATFAAETAAELGAKALGFAAAPAAAIPMALAPTEVARATRYPSPEESEQQMEKVVTEDVDIPFIQRRQEREEAAAPIERQIEQEGFATRFP
jgi:hypothetical protein